MMKILVRICPLTSHFITSCSVINSFDFPFFVSVVYHIAPIIPIGNIGESVNNVSVNNTQPGMSSSTDAEADTAASTADPASSTANSDADTSSETPTQSQTTKLWVENLIKPVFIMMAFIRAEREGDWPLHLWVVKAMMVYFYASGHFNYARYISNLYKKTCSVNIL